MFNSNKNINEINNYKNYELPNLIIFQPDLITFKTS